VLLSRRADFVLLARHPRWGYATMGFFAILLASFAVRFATFGSVDGKMGKRGLNLNAEDAEKSFNLA